MEHGIIFIVGSIQAFFLAFLLATREKKDVPDRFLIGWMFFLGVHLLAAYLSSNGIYRQHPRWFGLDASFPFVQGPFVYFYARLATRKTMHMRWIHALHLVPYFFFTIIFLYRIYSYQGPDLYAHLTTMLTDGNDLLLTLFGGLLHIHLVVYSVAAFFVLRTYSAALPNQFSYVEEINLTWLNAVVVGFCLISSTLVVGFFISDLLAWVSLNAKAYMFFFGLSALPFYLAYIAFTSKINYSPEPVPVRKYADSNLAPVQSKELATRLTQLMTEKKPYLAGKLAIVELAEMMDLSAKELSQVINENFEQNFFNYVNRYRVEEAKERMRSRQYDHLKLLNIGLDCGFNTKSSFNAIFKRFTGQTPSEYKAGLSK